MDLHIFNPETDYAMGCAGDNYNPPASVVNLRKEMALFPATYALRNDAIVVIDDLDENVIAASPYYAIARQKELSIIRLKELGQFIKESNLDHVNVRILPWGWNLSLRKLLLSHGAPLSLLKSESEIERIRSLAHRRTTIPFQRELAHRLPGLSIFEAREFNSEEEALAFAEENPGAYFKMPWSSSGRGVICGSAMSPKKLREWIHGAITRQGSVIAEHGYDRVADFATEWICADGVARFAGLSWFSTSSGGKYLHNEPISQKEIDANIKNASHLWGNDIIDAQREALGSLIAPYYNGALGIDMLADKDGIINPCVEINLRMTMGMATILRNVY